MKRIILILLFIAFVYQAWKLFHHPTLEPIQEKPYAIVYGPTPCAPTERYVMTLEKMGMNCIYKDVNKPGVGAELDSRMKKAGYSGHFPWPIIDVNGTIFVDNPDIEKLAEAYRNTDN